MKEKTSKEIVTLEKELEYAKSINNKLKISEIEFKIKLLKDVLVLDENNEIINQHLDNAKNLLNEITVLEQEQTKRSEKQMSETEITSRKLVGTVEAGLFEKRRIYIGTIDFYDKLVIDIGNRKYQLISSDYINSYSIINSQEKTTDIGGALAGGLFFGVAGALIGSSGKTYITISIVWGNDKKSLIRIDEDGYKFFLKQTFDL